MTSARSLFPWIFVAALSAGAVAACQAILGIDDIDSTPRPAGVDGGIDANPTAEQPVDPCVRRHPPGKLGAENGTGSGADGGLYVFALRQITFTPDGGGYDLDERCTGDVSSLHPESSCYSLVPSEPIPPDGPFGVDNQFSNLLITFPQGQSLELSINRQLDEGLHGALFVVREYNGGENDDSVNVSIVASEGLQKRRTESAQACTDLEDASADAQDRKLQPRWDGCDVWGVTPNTGLVDFLPIDSVTGYVRNRVLIIQPGSGPLRQPLRLPFATFDLLLNDGILTAELVAVDGGIALRNGTLAGRAVANDILKIVGNFNYASEDGGTKLCQSQFYAGLSDRVCTARDINAARTLDGKGPCDALSIALGFTAERAVFGSVGFEQPLSPCTKYTTCAGGDDAGTP